MTARNYDYTETNLQRLGRDYVSVGRYGGATLRDKLVEGSQRIISLVDIVTTFNPDVLISFPSPDAFRTAFGLGIPSIQINDTPHATAVGKLTISLANALVHPEAVKSSEFQKNGVSHFFPYSGVDETLWIKDFEEKLSVLDSLQLEKGNYIVARCEESKAAYFQRLYPSITPGYTTLIDIITKMKESHPNIDIVAFPRYKEQKEILADAEVIIPKKSVDTLSLFSNAKVVMTAGGTMGRESALLGTPTLYSFPLELAVNSYLYKKGFPLIHCPNHNDVPKQLVKLINTSRLNELVRIQLVDEMETPFDGIQRALRKIFSE